MKQRLKTQTLTPTCSKNVVVNKLLKKAIAIGKTLLENRKLLNTKRGSREVVDSKVLISASVF